MTTNPHFETADSWQAAEAMLTFRPQTPNYTAGFALESIRIYVRDHRQRPLAIGDRTCEAHYGSFVVSQSRREPSEARRLALEVSYGRDPIVGADSKGTMDVSTSSVPNRLPTTSTDAARPW